MIESGARVRWAGVQDPRCAPGFKGVVLKIAYHDENSVKVLWDERHTYTWERRKNLEYDSATGIILISKIPEGPEPKLEGTLG